VCTRLGVIFVLLILFLAVIAQNTEVVTIQAFFWTIEMSRSADRDPPCPPLAEGEDGARIGSTGRRGGRRVVGPTLDTR